MDTQQANLASKGLSLPLSTTDNHILDTDLAKPSKQVSQAITRTMKNDLNILATNFCDSIYPTTTRPIDSKESQYIKYTPKQYGVTLTQSHQRIIKITETQDDPLEPGKFKRIKVSQGLNSPPKTILHSPPRKVTVQDQQDWKIPPSISNTKNNRSYVIPLEMRLSADGPNSSTVYSQ